MQQLTFCVAWSGFPVMLSGKLGRLLVQSYEQLIGELFTLQDLAKHSELPGLLEQLTLPFPDQIRLQALELTIFMEKLKLSQLLKLEKLITPFLNQIKTRLVKTMK